MIGPKKIELQYLMSLSWFYLGLLDQLVAGAWVRVGDVCSRMFSFRTSYCTSYMEVAFRD